MKPRLQPCTILVVEDFEPYRRFIRSALEPTEGLQIVAEASGGLEAIQKAEELKPDLIVLDIGLPTLNGIEAARRIRMLAPKSKILFLTQESSADVVQECLRLGALGYVFKARAGTDLLAAVDAVLQGRRFVNSDLLSQNFIHPTDVKVPDRLHKGGALPSRVQSTPWPVLVAIFILSVAGVVLGVCNYQQRSLIHQLVAHEADLNATIAQLHSQLQDVTTKINDIAAVQVAHAIAVATTAQSNASVATAEASTQAKRLRQLQAAITDQQGKLQATQAEVAKARSDLEGNLNSTRSELNGSIARTHEELLVLEKRGESDYFEFDAAKSKEFQRTGPLNLSVRRTDTKHASVDLMLLVNDQEIRKKGVSLYEPVRIYEIKDTQPVQVVVNRIERNWVHGYVSAPKYSRAELSAIPTPAAPPTSTR